jgi:hypothetical protein
MRRLITALFLLGAPALALMPPHANSVSQPSGTTLTSRTITFDGYTLGRLDTMLTITDTAGAAVPFISDSKCEWIGEGDAPGARQQKCLATVTLTGPLEPGQTITLKLMSDDYTYTVPLAGLPETVSPTTLTPPSPIPPGPMTPPTLAPPSPVPPPAPATQKP